ncbi:hypothetical protein Gogos_018029 [Gossypium gossypioides]|uniref:DUF4283 domain-containing protein n=1 Tax=Gossypium gossypioides TaxID=34282 RepID=A0A7J9BCU7_GOSGO|nr:hypothetical protein [Gossypium gossypioides]
MGDSVGDSTGRFVNKVRHRLDELSDSDNSVVNDMGMKVGSGTNPVVSWKDKLLMGSDFQKVNTQKEDDFELLEVDAKKEIVNVKFQNDEDYLEALSRGLWTIFGHYLIVRLWTSTFTMDQDHLNSLMVWIRQPGLLEEDVPKRTSDGNHGKGASMQRRVGEEKFGPCIVVECRQRRNSRSGFKAKDASGDWKAEESRFIVLSENHEGMKDDGLNAIKYNEGNKDSRTVITYQILLVREKIVPLIKSKGFKK